MGFFEGAQNFEINGGNFIDMHNVQMQYNMHMMSVRGNNNNVQMNPTYNSGGPSSAYHAPRYGPTQGHTSTYPGYMPSDPPPTNSSHTHSSYSYTDPEQNVHYKYEASQFMNAQYQNVHQPRPSPPHPGQQPYCQPAQPRQQPYPQAAQPGQQPYHQSYQTGQQPYHQSAQAGQQRYPQAAQTGQQSHPQPQQGQYQPNYFPQQQQSTPTTDQYQRAFQNSTLESHQHRGATSSSSDSDDPGVTEITEDMERHHLQDSS